MSRTGFIAVSCVLASVSGAAFAQTATAPIVPVADTPAPTKEKAVKNPRVPRAGTATARAHGFLPLPLGAFAAIAGWGTTTGVIVTQNTHPASPD